MSAPGARPLLLLLTLCCLLRTGCVGNPDAKRLYDDLLSNYNNLVRPVVNVTDSLTVKIKFKLSQLIDVNLKNQIMTTKLWVEQHWEDYKLKWEPDEYGGVTMLHVPSDHIWRPDIVLYNNADGNFEAPLATKATLFSDGKVEWKPQVIYKSSCEIDVEYFPFDEQTCFMKFGSWTHDGKQVDLRLVEEDPPYPNVKIGVDLSDFYLSVEWDILDVPAIRHEKFYTCCDEPYLDITFNITMRRKTLFYTVNLIIPCMGISFLTVLVFFLPSDSGEKVRLSISILLSLTVFFLLLADVIPPTSLVVPLLGKFILFTMILATLSLCVTVVVLNIHFRSPQTHSMAPWVRRVFIHILPRLLVMRRPQYNNTYDKHRNEMDALGPNTPCRIHDNPSSIDEGHSCHKARPCDVGYCSEVYRAFEGVKLIAESTRREQDTTRVREDWKYVAMVLDRLFLWIFTLVVLVGTAGIILQVPTLYDDRRPSTGVS